MSTGPDAAVAGKARTTILIRFVDNGGDAYTVDASGFDTLMEVARANAIPGIDADCGGAGACATCHVYIDPAWHPHIGGPEDMEEAMLDSVDERRPTSRLSCQVKLNAELDGMIATLPAQQG